MQRVPLHRYNLCAEAEEAKREVKVKHEIGVLIILSDARYGRRQAPPSWPIDAFLGGEHYAYSIALVTLNYLINSLSSVIPLLSYTLYCGGPRINTKLHDDQNLGGRSALSVWFSSRIPR